MIVYDDRHSRYITELFAVQDDALRRVWEALPEKGFPAKTEAIRAFHRRVAAEPRVISTIYPGGDGMVVAVKTA